tara:strand:+ start:393 stop:878 length:486 start_codon:yes stop_codon:yes gene_type:complete
MKKISYIYLLLIISISIISCSGYKPIFNTSNLQFKITDYSITGDKKIGNQIYSKLYNATRKNKQAPEIKNINISIDSKKSKSITAKDSSGKAIGYRIILSTAVLVKNIKTGHEVINETISLSNTYKVQKLFSETQKLEDKATENLIDNIYQSLLLKLSENI